MRYQETTINGVHYSVHPPVNSQDMNYHFVSITGDHLVDLQDVIEWKYRTFEDDDDFPLHYGASIDDAIEYAKSYSDLIDGFWWKFNPNNEEK